MKENKNIERLFQEKFKDFEVTPPDFVWENIQSKLHPEEKKRRIVPLWFKVGSIAASLTLLFSLIFLTNYNENENAFEIINSNSKKQQTVSRSNNSTKINKEKNPTATSTILNSTHTKNHTTDKNINNGSYVSNSNKEYDNKNNYPTKKTLAQPHSKFTSTEVLVVNNKNKGKSTNALIDKDKSLNNNAVTYTSTKKKNKSKKTLKNIENGNLYFDLNSGLSSNNTNLSTKEKKRFKKHLSNKETNFNVLEDGLEINSNTITDNTTNNKTKSFTEKVTNSILTENTIENTINNSSNNTVADINSTGSNSLNEVGKNIENTDTLSSGVVANAIAKDTLPLVNVEQAENPLEKLLKEKEDNKKIADEKEKLSKWAVNSNVTPVYFNSFTEGSPISEDFITNTKNFNNSLSYGVGVTYQINKKLAIKTGINNLSLDYDTQDVAYYTSYKEQNTAKTNIQRNEKSKYIVLENQKRTSVNLIENQVLISGQNEGYLNQKMQYLELPVELSYSLINKKFGVALKGGFSTLILTENKISMVSESQQMEIGKATNLNNMHFSTNLGLGFSYNFIKNFQLNLEPMLKYQINAFTTNSGNFKPYIVGISTGLSYKF